MALHDKLCDGHWYRKMKRCTNKIDRGRVGHNKCTEKRQDP